MFLRLSAITLFILIVSHVLPARADEFVKHFNTGSAGQVIPDLLFVDHKGVQHDLKEYRGRYILLNVWASWCGPCVREMPSFNGLRNKFDFRALELVALDEDHNGIVAVKSFYNLYNLKNLPTSIDTSGQAPSLLHVHGLPTTIFIDPHGFEIGRIEGDADWDAPDTVAFLKSKMVGF